MAKNTGKGSRKGSVTGKTQFETPSGHYAKRDVETGQIEDVKTSAKEKFKGVAEEPDGRRTEA
ncbi:MAG TPA: hypothetical protein VND68_08850 [Chloroflexia bacterium]|nr:hypothetical protein [Chloroflexia bacterium]